MEVTFRLVSVACSCGEHHAEYLQPSDARTARDHFLAKHRALGHRVIVEDEADARPSFNGGHSRNQKVPRSASR